MKLAPQKKNFTYLYTIVYVRSQKLVIYLESANANSKIGLLFLAFISIFLNNQ